MKKEKNDAIKSANLKIQLLKLYYGKLRQTWEHEDDDRKLFCNLYDMLMEACEDMKKVTNNFIWVAFNKKFGEEEETLKEIAERFTKQ